MGHLIVGILSKNARDMIPVTGMLHASFVSLDTVREHGIHCRSLRHRVEPGKKKYCG